MDTPLYEFWRFFNFFGFLGNFERWTNFQKIVQGADLESPGQVSLQ